MSNKGENVSSSLISYFFLHFKQMYYIALYIILDNYLKVHQSIIIIIAIAVSIIFINSNNYEKLQETLL